jgi:hypothetical protein
LRAHACTEPCRAQHGVQDLPCVKGLAPTRLVLHVGSCCIDCWARTVSVRFVALYCRRQQLPCLRLIALQPCAKCMYGWSGCLLRSMHYAERRPAMQEGIMHVITNVQCCHSHHTKAHANCCQHAGSFSITCTSALMCACLS